MAGRVVLRLLLPLFFSCFFPLAAEEPVCDSSETGDCRDEGRDPNQIKWWTFNHTLDEFPVAGVNLASYSYDALPAGETRPSSKETAEEPFELFDDFSIAHLIRGDETWPEIMEYRNALQSPTLSFYVDKVARKRWLPQQGIAQPEVFALKYKRELLSPGAPTNLPNYVEAIRALLPTNKSYAAKPTHLSDAMGTWLVDFEDGRIHFSQGAKEVQEGHVDDVQVATSLANSLNEKALWYESWALKNVKPGIVVEERFMSHDNPLAPPHEFKVFTIWGRVWVGMWLFKRDGVESFWGFVYRNGTTTRGSPYGHEYGYETSVPGWVQWDKMVELAETLGANKDMFRTDIFIGIPKGGTGEIKVAVSECAVFPTVSFGLHQDDVGLQNEGTRLWLAGYKIGNYMVVENYEVPADYVESTADDQARDSNGAKLPTFNYTLDDFPVAGVNLASYSYVIGEQVHADSKVMTEQQFELYDDFDIADLIRGDESWNELIAYRSAQQRPGLSFYVDKIARKRWLPQQRGIDQPETFVTKYKDELLPSGTAASDYVQAIQTLLPTEKSYAAKPAHMSEAFGTWLIDFVDGKTYYSRGGKQLQEEDGMGLTQVATSLADTLHRVAPAFESWALRNVKPGIVIEERFMADDDPFAPPNEFKVFTLWGRVWVGQWNFFNSGTPYNWGFIYRNGTAAPGSSYAKWYGHDKRVPDWIQWDKMVEIAESLGAHKDMFRTDFFIGIPKGDTERKLVVSECEVFPTTVFGHYEGDEGLQDEGARLWTAGYKMGNYKRIENDEVPSDYVHSTS